MKDSIREKLKTVQERQEELDGLLGSPEVIQDQNRFRTLSKEYADNRPIVEALLSYESAEKSLDDAKSMMAGESDPEILAMAKEELEAAQSTIETLQEEIQYLLLPKDPDDDRDVYLEVRAGTGGDEAGLFAGDLARMYTRYAANRGWTATIVNESPSEQGGYKEVVLEIGGEGVYGRLKFESGGHRVQRVPATESQGRIHTSACTVAIMPKIDTVETIDIDPSDLRIDTYRASGAGGQHVNKTDSAVRVTHIPTNTVVECQDERSQHKNRAKAMSLLQSKILQAEKEKHAASEAQTRKLLVGSGDRSERIRTYNFPQGRVTDHRINLTLYQLEEFMEGNVDAVLDPLLHEYHADLLAKTEGNG